MVYKLLSMNCFHAHIYFTANDLAYAFDLTKRAQATGLFDYLKLHERAVGPHPTGMLEVHFNDLSYNAAVEWVQTYRKGFSVLLHQDTGDDIKDHTDGIRWLGEKLQLDFNFFELIKARPELRVHQ